MDSTFSFVRKPFHVLWTIHGNIRKGNDFKQVNSYLSLSLLFRSQRGFSILLQYRNCFLGSTRFCLNDPSNDGMLFSHIRCIRRIFNREGWGPCNMKQVIFDFERATWKAFNFKLPLAILRGCFFHWAQAVQKKIRQAHLYYNKTTEEERRLSACCWHCHCFQIHSSIPNFKNSKGKLVVQFLISAFI